MPKQEILARATLALCSHSEIHHHQLASLHADNTGPATPAWREAGHACSHHPFTGSTKHPWLCCVMGTGLLSGFAARNRVQPLAVAAPKNQLCPTLWWQAASKAWADSRAVGARERGPSITEGQRGVSPGAQSQRTCSQAVSPCRSQDLGPQLPAEQLSSFPSHRAAHPQLFNCQFASAANLANSKFHSHLWKGARIAKIRLANVFRNTNTHVNLEPKIPSGSPKA